MKFEIILSEQIAAPKDTVWEVISDTSKYPEWNTFVVKCESSFEVGSPIKMRVRVLPFFAMPQKETILQNQPGDFLEYGINVPGLLKSSRQHRLTVINDNLTRYDSVFMLKGILAPVVGFLLGNQLKRGFNDMTRGVVDRALSLQKNRS